MNFIIVSLQIILALLVFLYFYYKKKYSYWIKKGVVGPSPKWIVGNFHEFFLKGQINVEMDWNKKYGNIYGIYRAHVPHLSICDVEIAKQILIKDFPNFINREIVVFQNEYWDHNMFNAEDEKWKRIRSITSPTFTSGKLKVMAPLINRSTDKLIEHFNRIIAKKDGKIDVKKSIIGFTINVISVCVFAAEVDANSDEDMNNTHPVVYYGIKAFEIDPFRFFSILLLPNKVDQFLQKHNITSSVKAFNFLINLVLQIVKTRKESKFQNQDLIQLMMDAYTDESFLNNFDFQKLAASMDTVDIDSQINDNDQAKSKTNHRTLSEKEIVAQCLLFFVAGFETTASTISHMLYELSLNPDVQERLRNEINEALGDIDPNTDKYYEILNTKIPYLNACIKETLRKYPPVTRLQRRSGKDGLKIAGITLDKDITIEICVYSIHHDEKNFPDPEAFNPERFMPENKHLVAGKYFPFGEGPRNCVGMRFAYLEMKYAFSKILPKFFFEPTAETKIPLEMSKFGILTAQNIQLKISPIIT